MYLCQCRESVIITYGVLAPGTGSLSTGSVTAAVGARHIGEVLLIQLYPSLSAHNGTGRGARNGAWRIVRNGAGRGVHNGELRGTRNGAGKRCS